MNNFEKLTELGINLNEKHAQLEEFMRLFLECNEKINLISRHDAGVFFDKHIYDSLAFNLFKQKYFSDAQKTIKLLDIGSGGGLPALPLSICFDNIDVCAVDSIQKKINFIKFAADALGLKNIHSICKRAEELPFKAVFDAAASRAAAEMRIILEYAVPYLKTGGFLVLYKSIKAAEEIKNAQHVLKVLKSEVIDEIEYTLPMPEKYKRTLVIVRKNGGTPEIYPRKNGLAAKKPL